MIVLVAMASPQDEGPVLEVGFDTARLEGWDLAGAARVVDGLLQLDGPGHAFWFAAHGADYRLGFRYRPGEGVGEIVLSASGEPPHHQQYALRLFGPEMELVRISGGDERHLGSAPVGMEPGAWQQVELERSGGHIRVAVDGRPVLEAVDEQPLPPGATAFGCLAGGGFAYDDLSFRPSGGAEPHIMAEAEVRHHEPPVESEPQSMMARPPVGESGESFTADFGGGTAPGWDLEPGWSVEAQQEAGFALRGRGHSWARCKAGDWGDSTMSLRLCLVRGAIHLNYRVHDTSRYFIGIHSQGLALHKQTGPQSFSGPLARAARQIPPDSFVEVQISGEGGRLQVTLDGQPVLEYRDPQPLTHGGIAFETLDESEAWVEAVRVTGSDRPPTPAASMAAAQPDDAPQGQEVEQASPMVQADPMVQVQPSAPADPKVQADPMVQAPPTAETAPAMQMQASGQAEMVQVSLPAGPQAAAVAVLDRIPERSLGQLQKAYVWDRMGGPLGGLGYDVRMRPGTPGVMYVSDAWAGVFKSVDGGSSWQPANQGIDNRRGGTRDAIPIFCLTVDPHQPETIWVGNLNERGVYRTDNGGQNWFRRENGIAEKDGLTVRGFTVHPKNRNTVFMGAEIISTAWNKKLNNSNKALTGKNFDKTMGVLYKTTDGGQSWTAVRYFDNLVRYIWIDPKNPNIMYLSTGIFDREARNTDAKAGTPGGVGVFKSTDGGATWSPANNGLGNLYVGSLFMHPTNPQILLAGTGCNPWQQSAGVYLTTDGAQSWKQTLPGDVITAVEFAESDPKIAYAGSSSRIYRSPDGGLTWVPMTPGKHWWGPPGIRAGWPIDFQVDPKHSDRVFANAYGGGNFLSDDGGATWADASQGYTGAQIRDIAVAPGGTVWAAARSGIFVSSDGGRTWAGMNYPPAMQLDWPLVTVDPGNPHHVLGGTLWNALLFERRGARGKWRLAHQLKLPQGERVGFTALIFAPSNGEVAWAGTGGVASFGQLKNDLPGMGVYRSTDGGATWSPANDLLSQGAHVKALLVDPADDSRLWAATSTHGVLFTTNNGGSWLRLNRGLPEDAGALSIAARPGKDGELFVGLDRAGLYRSTDGGQSWKPFMNGMNPNASVSDIVFDPTDARIIYAADKLSGVYVWERGNDMWRRINYRLHNRDVNALAVTSDGGYLYAATEGSGVYRATTPP
jgi:photosystem II stability/assembly factor-like uncharacterized protein